MNPRDFLDVADDLAAGLREADWRSAVSRAYYAAFHVGRRLLRRCGFVVPEAEQAHGYVWLRLANSGHPDIQLAGNNLATLRRVRNLADYDLARPLAHSAAIGQVQAAAETLRVLEDA